MKQTVWILLLAIAARIGYEYVDRSKTYYVPDRPGIVVITGATSGLGLDSAYHFASNGYLVLAGARSQKKADVLQEKAEIKGFKKDAFRAIVLDVTDASHWDQALRETKDAMEETGREFCGLINNAGVHHRMFKDNPEDPDTLSIWRKVFEVNLFAVVGLTQIFEDLIIASKARIVNIGSIAGELSIPTGEPYSATKFGLRAISTGWRAHYAPMGVSVSLVEPGYVASQMCDPKKESVCGVRGPEDTTTPAYFDAIASATPKSKYIVSDVMFVDVPYYGKVGIPGTFFVPLMHHFVPSRVQDAIAANVVKDRQQDRSSKAKKA